MSCLPSCLLPESILAGPKTRRKHLLGQIGFVPIRLCKLSPGLESIAMFCAGRKKGDEIENSSTQFDEHFRMTVANQILQTLLVVK